MHVMRLTKLTESGLNLHPCIDAAGQAVGPLLSPIALPLGDVQVHVPQRPDGLVSDFEKDHIRIEVLDVNRKVIDAHTVQGRQGLNDLYQRLIGYRPDDDVHLGDMELLQLTAEVAYRQTTGDFA